jgi:hypothetical protein
MDAPTTNMSNLIFINQILIPITRSVTIPAKTPQFNTHFKHENGRKY